VYSTVLSIKPDNAVKVILATFALHNFLRAKVPNRYIPKRLVNSEDQLGRTRDGSWRIDECGKQLRSFSKFQKRPTSC
jgi:transcriptional regulator